MLFRKFASKAIMVFTFLGLISIGQGMAQLVNIEKLRKDKKEGMQGAAALALTLTQNTRQIFEVNNQVNLQYHKAPHTILLINNIGFMRVEGDNLINNGFQHLRYNYEVTPSFLTLEALTQHQYNAIRLLQQRFLLGGGPRLKLVETGQFALFLAPLVIYEYERFSDELATETRKFKGNFYVSARLDINERVFLSHTTYYQPDFAIFREFRLASDTSLEMKISENFSFEVIFDLLYDSYPPEDIPNTFYTLRNGLRYSF
jgi:hypothetical protein